MMPQGPQITMTEKSKKKRISIPKYIAEAVLKEYRFKCAICGRTNPQLHHLDEDPSNNDPQNLLPLCPNCHLQDTHDPTSPPAPLKLRLFRLHKDPLVLDPRFHPIFLRIAFLHEKDLRPNLFKYRANELLSFISELKMGTFYRKKILDYLNNFIELFILKYEEDGKSITKPDVQTDQSLRTLAYEFRKQEIERLVIEQLRYQGWAINSLTDH
jgi:hypothetical protein